MVELQRTKTSYMLPLILALVVTTWKDSSAFTSPSTRRSTSTLSWKTSVKVPFHLPPCRTILWAKNVSKAKKATTSSANGGGFGTKAITVDNQVRSVSGHRGSGEKPLRQAANAFDEIRKNHGAESTHDVYCRSPLNDKEIFWFVGKIAVRPDTAATPEQATLSQKRLILEYAKRELRPQNLGGKYSNDLELWLAPGDSEMDAVQNKISLLKVEGSTADLTPEFSVRDVGYNPEIYVGDEREKGGLRIKRDEQGKPVKPVFDVNQSL